MERFPADTQSVLALTDKNQWLVNLNLILSILGMRFEDIFDKTQLPEQAEDFSDGSTITDEFEDSMDDGMLLKEINSKLDRIIRDYSSDKHRKTYLARCSDLFQCISIRNYTLTYKLTFSN